MTAYTREQILAMEQKELNLAVAIYVMGYKLDKNRLGNILNDVMSFPPKRYSEDISAAWYVIEKIQPEWSWDMRMYNAANEVEVWIGKGFAVSKSVPEAICKAALLAVLGL